MEQPLADVYFLVVMEHMRDEKMADMRLETLLYKITNISEVCWKWELVESVCVYVQTCDSMMYVSQWVCVRLVGTR